MTTIKYVTQDVILRVEHKFIKRWVSGAGDKATFAEDSIGWYAIFTSCPVAMYLGLEEPVLKAGDRVRLILEA